jgi:CzcA family heavy metal efflux pump
MIRRIISSSLRFRVLMAVTAVVVMVVGLTQLPHARRDVYPEFSPPTVEIQTEALGLSAEEVEQLITVPLEADLLNGVAWVDDIRSESVLGLSSVTMVFKPGTDLYRARQAVQERLAQAHALPQVSAPPQMLQPTSSTGRTMMIGLTSERLSLIELSQLARWTIKPRLQGVKGVANVASFGQRERQLQVQVDPKRLAAKGVSLQNVIDSTGNSLWVSPLTFLEASSPGTGGFIETPNQRLTVRHVSPIESAADLAKVAIDDKPGVSLGDVASVVEDHQPLIGDALINGGPGVLLVVEKLLGSNTLDVTHGVEKALAELSPALTDVKIDTSLYRPADYIDTGGRNLAQGLIVGLALLILLLAFALLQWRAAVITVVTILVSTLGATLVLVLRGETLNWMVLTGLAVALGAVVDDAITGTDRVLTRLRETEAGSEAVPVATTIVAVLSELRTSLAFATGFILLPVLPVFFMGDLFHYFGRPLAISYAVALGVSTVAALTVAPALTVLLFSRASQAGTESRVVRNLGHRYTGLLSRMLANAGRPLAVALVLALAAMVCVPLLGRSELPVLKERDFLIELEAAPGTSLVEMNRISAQATNELKAVPGVRAVSSHAGRAVTGDQVVNVNKAEMWVGIAADADYGKAVRGLRDVMARYKQYDTDTLTYQQFALKEIKDKSDGPIIVRVYGHNEQVLNDKAKELGDKLKSVAGIDNLQVELPVNQATLEVEVNLDKAAEYGVKPGDVRRAAATLLSGIEVGSLFYDEKVFQVVVWGAPQVRKNIADVTNLQIETPTKGLVPLSTLASVKTVNSPSVIEREGAFRRIDITADVVGRGRAAVAADVHRLITDTKFPLEFRAELLGGYVQKQAADRRLLALAGFALLAMMLLLQAAFGSWRLGAVVFLTLPVALTGGLAAVAAAGGTISIGATVGLLTLLGLAARTGIVQVRRYQQLQRREGVPFGLDLVLQGARERFVPTVLSVLATGLVFVPFAVAGDVAGQEIIHPMALVVLGGLVTVLLVSLLIVPALYLAFGGKAAETELDLLLFEQELAAMSGSIFVPVAAVPPTAGPVALPMPAGAGGSDRTRPEGTVPDDQSGLGVQADPSGGIAP